MYIHKIQILVVVVNSSSLGPLLSSFLKKTLRNIQTQRKKNWAYVCLYVSVMCTYTRDVCLFVCLCVYTHASSMTTHLLYTKVSGSHTWSAGIRMARTSLNLRGSHFSRGSVQACTHHTCTISAPDFRRRIHTCTHICKHTSFVSLKKMQEEIIMAMWRWCTQADLPSPYHCYSRQSLLRKGQRRQRRRRRLTCRYRHIYTTVNSNEH